VCSLRSALMPLVSSCLVARRRAAHDGAKRGPAYPSQVVCSAMTARLLRTTISYATQDSVVFVSLSFWHKTRGVSSQICDTLPPGNSRVALPILQGGFVSPLRVALHARVSPHDQHTLAMQMDAMQELTTRRGWTVIDARADMGSGATATPRCKGCCMGTSRVACARA
jgi:hypothetical protein